LEFFDKENPRYIAMAELMKKELEEEYSNEPSFISTFSKIEEEFLE